MRNARLVPLRLAFAIVVVAAVGNSAAADLASLNSVQSAAEANDRPAFQRELAAAQETADDSRPAVRALIDVYRTLNRVWTYAFTSSTGAFFSEGSEGGALVQAMRQYPGFEDAVRRHTIVDASGERYYPTAETRTFLVALARTMLAQLQAPPAPLPAPVPVQVPAPAPVPRPQPPPPPLNPVEVRPEPLPGATVTVVPIDDGPIRLTLEEALRRATRPTAEQEAAIGRALLDVERMRASRYPSLRAVTEARASRTTDVFANRPLNFRSVSSTIAVDYAIVPRSLLSAREAEAASEAEYLRARIANDRATYERVVHAYSELYGITQRKALLDAAVRSVEAAESQTRHLLETGQISIVTATTSREAVLSLRARVLDLEMQRFNAQRRLREIIGDSSGADIIVDLGPDLERPEVADAEMAAVVQRSIANDDTIARLERDIARSRLAIEEADTRRRPQLALSAYAGVGAARSNFEFSNSSSGGTGIYGLHIGLSYPLFDRARQIDRAAAQLTLERDKARLATATEARRVAASERLREYIESGKRLALLTEWSAVEREREASLRRLIDAGVRREAELSKAVADRMPIEEQLLDLRLQRWRLSRLLRFPETNF